ncbi:MAG: peptidase and in kexin sedolisin [Myxococcales bacterium]|nr:peptidase and in kexin sedolisin [Myxococcales bacterium]
MLYRFAAILPLVVGCASAGKDTGRNTGTDSGIQLLDSGPGYDSVPLRDAPPGCVMQTQELLVNGNFDSAPLGTGWTQSDPSLVTSADGVAEQSAPNKGWLGGVTSGTDLLYQDVAIPASTTALAISGFFDVRSAEDPNDPLGPYDFGRAELVTTGGTLIDTIGTYDDSKPQAAWVALSHTFTANVAGQTVRLRFTSTNDGINPTSFYFDTLSLRATICP